MTIDAFIKRHLPAYQDRDFDLPFDVEQKKLNVNDVITDDGHVENKLLLLNEGVLQADNGSRLHHELLISFRPVPSANPIAEFLLFD